MNDIKEKIKKSSKTMAVITKVICISLIVGLVIPVGVLVCFAVAPNTDFFTTNQLSFYSSTGQLLTSRGEIIAEMGTIIVSGGLILYFLLTAYSIFSSIAKDAMPFSQENAKRIKKIAILLLVYSMVAPISKAGFYKSFAPQITIQSSLNIVSIVLALIFFFISVVFAYGAELQRQYDETL